jgi:hypothetical protein
LFKKEDSFRNGKKTFTTFTPGESGLALLLFFVFCWKNGQKKSKIWFTPPYLPPPFIYVIYEGGVSTSPLTFLLGGGEVRGKEGFKPEGEGEKLFK